MSADPASVKDLARFAEPWDADSWDVKPGAAPTPGRPRNASESPRLLDIRADYERRAVLYTPDGRALVRRAGFRP